MEHDIDFSFDEIVWHLQLGSVMVPDTWPVRILGNQLLTHVAEHVYSKLLYPR